MPVNGPVSGKAGAVRIQRLGGVALAAAEAHGKRNDALGKARSIDGAPPVTTTGLDLNDLYEAHIKGAHVPKSGTKALHMLLQFPKELVDGEDADLMLHHSRRFAESVFGDAAEFSNRVDRDEGSRHVVDLFLAPKYEKKTKHTSKLAVSTSIHLKALAEKHGRAPTLRGQGQALQDAWHQYLQREMGLDVQRGSPKRFPGSDWQTPEDIGVEIQRQHLREENQMLASANQKAAEIASEARREAQDAVEAKTRAKADLAALEALRPAAEAYAAHLADLERARTAEAQQKPLADALDWLFEPARTNALPEGVAAKLMAQRINATAGIDAGELKFGGFDLDARAAESDAEAMPPNQFEAARIMAKTPDLWEAGVRYDPAFGRNRFTFDHKAIYEPDLVKGLHRDGFDFRNAAIAIRDSLARVLPRIYAVLQGRALGLPMAPPEAAKPITSLPEPLQEQIINALAPVKPDGPNR